MSKMISVASGFQYSVNIGYDLSSNEKLKNFIPTKSSLGLLEEILLSTAETSTERSRVLIGAYGKGKSHFPYAPRRHRQHKRLVVRHCVAEQNTDFVAPRDG